MSSSRLLSALAALSLLGLGCTEGSAVGASLQTDAAPPVDAGKPDAASAPSPSSAPSSAPARAPETRAPVELLKLVLASGVQKKEPVDKLDEVAAGSRVYAHLTLRNRSGAKRKVHVDFLVNGKLRTPLELDVEPSWSYRTWGYNTLQPTDKGELEVRVLDEAGATLAASRVPIRSEQLK